MQIDDTVKITGPDRHGNYNEHGTFKINMVWKDKVQNYYSDGDRPWYPESSLELVSKPETFEIGQRVRIIGNSMNSDGPDETDPEEFTITQKADDGRWYSDIGMSCYPASSLELVEEGLKIGDEVEVIGPAGVLYAVDADDPKKFIIQGKNGRYYYGDRTKPGYPASSLRKISKPMKGLISGIEFHDQALGFREIDALYREGKLLDRLTSIEKQLADLDQVNANINRRLDEQKEVNSELRKRIHILEEHDMYQAEVNDDLRSRLASLEKSWMEHELERTSRFTKSKSHVVSKILDEPEIKIGDWCQVMEKSCHDYGKIFKVSGCVNHEFLSDGPNVHYDPRSLRKLSNAEISKRLNGRQA